MEAHTQLCDSFRRTLRILQIAAVFVLWQGCMHERNSQTVRRWLIV